jgi:hypothetical protein
MLNHPASISYDIYSIAHTIMPISSSNIVDPSIYHPAAISYKYKQKKYKLIKYKN